MTFGVSLFVLYNFVNRMSRVDMIMDIFLVAVVVTALAVMACVLINRNMKYRALSTPNRWYASMMIGVQSMVLLSSLIAGGDVLLRLYYDMLPSAICLSFLTSSLMTRRSRKMTVTVMSSAGVMLAVFYILCAAGVLRLPSQGTLVRAGIVMTVMYLSVFLFMMWYRIRDIHSLMQSASVWSWLTFSVDVFYMCFIVMSVMISSVFMSSFPLMVLMSVMMTGLLLAYMHRVNMDSAFAVLQRHERTIVESMKISSVDASAPGPGEEHMYKELFERVQSYFEEEKPFLNGNLTINDVVAEVFSNKVYISRAISHFTGRNFCQYVNYHRVMHAMECYRANPSLKVSELWPMCGFNTIVSFNMAFRLFMNENPSDWCRKERMKLSRNRK